MRGGGTIKITPHEAHTGDKTPSNVVGFLERVVRSKINDDRQPRFLVGWALGHKGADIITVMEDGSVRYIGSSVLGNTVPKDAVLQMIMNFTTLSERWKTRNQRCKVVWRANMESASILVGNTFIVDRQFFPLS